MYLLVNYLKVSGNISVVFGQKFPRWLSKKFWYVITMTALFFFFNFLEVLIIYLFQLALECLASITASLVLMKL